MRANPDTDRIIVNSPSPITLVGAGETGTAELNDALRLAPRAVAVDGGLAALLGADVTPEAILGDMDSARVPDTLAGRVRVLENQDFPDFDKALAAVRAPLILAVGFLGGRLDHQMAVTSGLMRAPGSAVILLGPRDVAFLCPPALRLDPRPGTRLSLFPLVPVTVEARGLRWPLEKLALTPAGRLGTSNVAEGPVEVSVDGPGLMVILPRRCLDIAVTALAAQPARWPETDAARAR